VTSAVRTIRRGRWKLSVHAEGAVELYDLMVDPGERWNVAGAANESIVRGLCNRLSIWQRQTVDTLDLATVAR